MPVRHVPQREGVADGMVRRSSGGPRSRWVTGVAMSQENVEVVRCCRGPLLLRGNRRLRERPGPARLSRWDQYPPAPAGAEGRTCQRVTAPVALGDAVAFTSRG